MSQQSVPAARPPNPFRRATKERSRLRLALIGPAGSGKTYTALALASAIGGRVAVVDTEHGSASKYASEFAFDVLELESFHPLRYVEAVAAAEAAGYTTVVLDSLSHAWAGKGGGLELHDEAVARQKTKNTYTAWGDVTPHQEAMVEAIIRSRCHVIATMRSKTAYVQEKDERTGRTTVRRVGMAPVQRDGLEYEFDLVADLDQDNTLVVSKTRCPALFGAVVRKPGAPLARDLMAWLNAATAPDASPNGRAPEQTPAAPAGGPGASEPSPQPRPKGPSLPRSGEELLNRLEGYDARLHRQGLCAAGALIQHVRNKGIAAGYSANLKEWAGAAIRLAVDETKAFERDHREKATPEQAAALPGLAWAAGYQGDDWRTLLAQYGAQAPEDLSRARAAELKEFLEDEAARLQELGEESQAIAGEA
jgi:hypothetical protein